MHVLQRNENTHSVNSSQLWFAGELDSTAALVKKHTTHLSDHVPGASDQLGLTGVFGYGIFRIYEPYLGIFLNFAFWRRKDRLGSEDPDVLLTSFVRGFQEAQTSTALLCFGKHRVISTICASPQKSLVDLEKPNARRYHAGRKFWHEAVRFLRWREWFVFGTSCGTVTSSSKMCFLPFSTWHKESHESEHRSSPRLEKTFFQLENLHSRGSAAIFSIVICLHTETKFLGLRKTSF